MKSFLLFAAAALAVLSLNACYTPRDVRPAAVAEAKATAARDLPKLAAAVAGNRGARAAMVAKFEAYLTKHPGVYGVAFAPVPASAPAIYVYRHGGGFQTRELAPPAYDYARMEWYRKPIALGAAHWSAPYFDKEGGEVWMQTLSVSLAGGVITNDVPVYGPHAN